MPIQLNPFRPAYDNLLVPLTKSLVKPYANLLDDSVIPLYNSFIHSSGSYQEGVEKFNCLLKTLELVAQISIYFFVYQKGWDFGLRYFGLAGGGVACTLIYGLGHIADQQLNTRFNDISTGSWLYFKGGRALLSSFGANREAALAALLVGGYLGTQHQKSSATNGWDATRQKMAEQLAWFFGYRKLVISTTPPPSSPQQ